MLDPADPISMGAMVGPEAFTEVKYLAHHRQMQALDLIPQVQKEFEAIFGRDSGGLLHEYRTEDAETIVLCLGSVTGTVQDVVDQRRAAGERIGVVSLVSFRPFPRVAVRRALRGAKTVVVMEKAFSVGIGGIVSADVGTSLLDEETERYELIAGLGGRDITSTSLHEYFDRLKAGTQKRFKFLDLNRELVDKELERERGTRRSGSIPENLIKDVTEMALEEAGR
ncbi:MAG: hypothetical protein ACTHW1_06605 [Ancrocorticia sp.]|uniref:hypothetical protein n=1 Tax=Ancrocorticia sp. TaxID=2593684 RepID=UPI003F913B72